MWGPILFIILLIAAAAFVIQVGRKPRVRQRLVAHWWVWLPIAVIAAILNDLIDRTTGSGVHPVGDIVLAIVIVAVAFLVSEFVAHRKSRRAP